MRRRSKHKQDPLQVHIQAEISIILELLQLKAVLGNPDPEPDPRVFGSPPDSDPKVRGTGIDLAPDPSLFA